MKPKCYVLEGKFKGQKISALTDCIYLPKVDIGYKITKHDVASYQLLDESSKNSSEYSVWKGLLGIAAFGSAGAVAGIGGKATQEYIISIEWEDGRKSLIVLDEYHYKKFVRSMF